MSKLFTTVEEAADLHDAGKHAYFFHLMDRLEAFSKWKYPDRPWSVTSYYFFAIEWSDKILQLEYQVKGLEKQMYDDRGEENPYAEPPKSDLEKLQDEISLLKSMINDQIEYSLKKNVEYTNDESKKTGNLSHYWRGKAEAHQFNAEKLKRILEYFE